MPVLVSCIDMFIALNVCGNLLLFFSAALTLLLVLVVVAVVVIYDANDTQAGRLSWRAAAPVLMVIKLWQFAYIVSVVVVVALLPRRCHWCVCVCLFKACWQTVYAIFMQQSIRQCALCKASQAIGKIFMRRRKCKMKKMFLPFPPAVAIEIHTHTHIHTRKQTDTASVCVRSKPFEK